MKSNYWLIDTNDQNWWLWDAGNQVTEEEAVKQFEWEESDKVKKIQSASPPWEVREQL